MTRYKCCIIYEIDSDHRHLMTCPVCGKKMKPLLDILNRVGFPRVKSEHLDLFDSIVIIFSVALGISVGYTVNFSFYLSLSMIVLVALYFALVRNR